MDALIYKVGFIDITYLQIDRMIANCALPGAGAADLHNREVI